MKPAAFEYSTDLALLAQPGARALGGGQSLGPMLNLRLARPAILVDVKHLRGVVEHADWVRLGAATTHADIEDGRVPDPAGGLLRHVARGIAYRAVRNRGTLGGSLAHADPAADWPSVMAALGATIITGQGRRLPAPNFMLAPFTTALLPGELIAAVEIPRLAGPWGHCKLNRKTGEFAHAIGIALSVAPPVGLPGRQPGDLPGGQHGRLLVGAIEAPPMLVARLEDAPTPLSRLALARAIAMRDA